MPRLEVLLSEQQTELVERLIRDGTYQHANEVLQEALRLLEQRMTDESIKLQALRSALDAAEAAVAAGELQDFGPGFVDEIDDEVHARSAGERR